MNATISPRAATDQVLSNLRGSRTELVRELEAAGAVFRGNTCKCILPPHDDTNASAGVYCAEGIWRYKCHGCGANEDIIGMRAAIHNRTAADELRDLRGNPSTIKNPAPEPAKPKKIHQTFKRAVVVVEWSVSKQFKTPFKLAKSWRYDRAAEDGSSIEFGYILRLESEAGKEKAIRPIAPVNGGFVIGDPPGLWPLLYEPDLADGGVIVVCEGEGKTDLCRTMGFNATSPAHGAKSPHKTDWRIVAGQEVAVVLDNDAAGEKFGQDVAAICTALQPPARVKLIRLPGLPNKGDDLKEWTEAGGTAEQLHALIEAAPQWTPANAQPAGPLKTNSAAGEWEPDRLSQQANAERLICELDGNARYNVSRGEWMQYRPDEGRLVHDERGEVCRAAKRVARQTWDFIHVPPHGCNAKVAFRHALDSEKAAGISSMLKLAQTEPGISITASDLDRDGYLVNTRNAVINLRDGTARPHHREDLFSKLAPIDFDAKATAPRWLTFLSQIMDGNATMIGYLQRIAGLCLSADITIQELFIFWGGGANGKSVFVDTLIGMFGDYAGTAPESLLTMRSGGAEHPTEIADLCGKRLVAASETEEGAKLRVQLVKRLTGDATIKARFMRQDYFEFQRTHKLILVTNNRPCIRETTNAVWRRVRLIPFTVTIPPEQRDTQLLEKLKAEWPGILNWCIAGFLDFQADGMRTPVEVTIATAAYQSEQNPLEEYLSERCVIEQSAFVSRQEIFADYSAWAKSIGDVNPDRNGFYERLRRVSGISETMRRVNGRPANVFSGIGLANLGTQYRQSQEALTQGVRA